MLKAKEDAETASTKQKISGYLQTHKSTQMNVFEKTEAEVRWRLELEDKFNELEKISSQYETILKNMEDLKEVLFEKQKRPENTILTNKQFLELMGISSRTGQTWRDNELISFSQVGNCIYYRLSDILIFLSNYFYESK